MGRVARPPRPWNLHLPFSPLQSRPAHLPQVSPRRPRAPPERAERLRQVGRGGAGPGGHWEPDGTPRPVAAAATASAAASAAAMGACLGACSLIGCVSARPALLSCVLPPSTFFFFLPPNLSSSAGPRLRVPRAPFSARAPNHSSRAAAPRQLVSRLGFRGGGAGRAGSALAAPRGTGETEAERGGGSVAAPARPFPPTWGDPGVRLSSVSRTLWLFVCPASTLPLSAGCPSLSLWRLCVPVGVAHFVHGICPERVSKLRASVCPSLPVSLRPLLLGAFRLALTPGSSPASPGPFRS